MNLSTVKMLAPHLTPENVDRVIGEASGRSKRDVEKIVARLAPKPDVAASVRKVPEAPAPIARVEPTPPVPPIVVMAPLTPDRYRFQFTASEGAYETFLQVQRSSVEKSRTATLLRSSSAR